MNNQTMFYPVSNRGGMGESFNDKAECQAYCDSISTQSVFWWAQEISTSTAERTRSEIY